MKSRAPFCLYHNRWTYAAPLAFLVGLAYLPIVHANFIWDDRLDFRLDGPVIWSKDLYRIWCTTDLADYYPLTWTVCLVESWLFGQNPLGYHLVNLALHIMGVIILWRVLLYLPVRHPWVISLLFGLHPLTVASVAWACEIKNTLSFVFYATTVLFYLKHVDDPPHAHVWYQLSLGSFALALLSKISGVGLPLFMFTCVWWRQKRLSRRDLAAIAPFLLLSALMACVGIWFQLHRAIGDDVASTDDFATRMAMTGSVFWFYIGKSLLPLHLMMIYPEIPCDPKSALAWLPDFALMALIVTAWCSRATRWGRSLLFALFYVLLMLLPVMGFVDMAYMRFSRVADQFSYLALCGLLSLYLAAFAYVCERLAYFRAAWVPCVIGFAAILGVLTWERTLPYRDAEIFWKDNLQQNPDAWCGWTNLAQDLANRGVFSASIPYYDRRLRIRSVDAQAWYDRGIALMNCRRLEEAEADFRQAIRLRPGYAKAHNNLALVLQKFHRDKEAREHFERAILEDATNVEACDNLANLWARGGHDKEAYDLYMRAVTVDPHFAEGWCNLGAFLADRGRSEEALRCYQMALRIRPDFAEVHTNLGIVLSRLGRNEEALAAYKTVCRISPRKAEGYNAVGTVEAARGNFNEAIAWFERAVAVNPSFAQAYNNMALMYVTAAEPARRNGPRALALARRACELSGGGSAEMVHTLAAAYAECGRFAEAVHSDEQALRMATQAQDMRLQTSIRHCLVLLRAGKPCR